MAELTETFRCEKYRCSLQYLRCLERQAARQLNRTTGKQKVPLFLEYCASGACAQGQQIREQFAGVDITAPQLWTGAVIPTPKKKKEEEPVGSPCRIDGCTRAAREDGGLCFFHEAPPELPPAPATPEVVAPKPAPEEPAHEENTTMETEAKCPGCSKKLRRDNSRGACSKCIASGKVKAIELQVRPAAEVKALPVPPPTAPATLDVTKLSDADLVQLVRDARAEAKRRLAEKSQLEEIAA
ncbi:MAG: hypothetical protein ACK4N5_07675 [Myxococcales bacterium]